jgi:putative endonuclease
MRHSSSFGEEAKVNNLRQVLGKEGEKAAERYLRKKGYRVVERNYRCSAGEVDLIVLDRRVVVFVEVKTRTDHRFGTPLEAVEFRKQQKMIQAAQFFLNRKDSTNAKRDSMSSASHGRRVSR